AAGLCRLGRHFWPHLRGQWLLVLASLGALFAEVALQLLEPWPLKLVLDRVLASPKNGSGPAFLNALDPTIVLTLIAIGLVAITRLRALATAPRFWIRTVKLSGLIKEASRKQRQRDGAMAATAVESIGAIKIVQALSLERTFSDAFSSANAKSLRAGVRASRLSASLERSVDLFVAVATALVLWFG